MDREGGTCIYVISLSLSLFFPAPVKEQSLWSFEVILGIGLFVVVLCVLKDFPVCDNGLCCYVTMWVLLVVKSLWMNWSSDCNNVFA